MFCGLIDHVHGIAARPSPWTSSHTSYERGESITSKVAHPIRHHLRACRKLFCFFGPGLDFAIHLLAIVSLQCHLWCRSHRGWCASASLWALKHPIDVSFRARLIPISSGRDLAICLKIAAISFCHKLFLLSPNADSSIMSFSFSAHGCLSWKTFHYLALITFSFEYHSWDRRIPKWICRNLTLRGAWVFLSRCFHLFVCWKKIEVQCSSWLPVEIVGE